MPEKRTIERARKDAREGKSPSTQAGEFVREEIDHVREGKHGARSAKQAIAIGLSKARRAGVKLPRRPGNNDPGPRRSAPDPERSRSAERALRRGAAPRGLASGARRPGASQRRAARRRGAQGRREEGSADERPRRTAAGGEEGRANARTPGEVARRRRGPAGELHGGAGGAGRGEERASPGLIAEARCAGQNVAIVTSIQRVGARRILLPIATRFLRTLSPIHDASRVPGSRSPATLAAVRHAPRLRDAAARAVRRVGVEDLADAADTRIASGDRARRAAAAARALAVGDTRGATRR